MKKLLFACISLLTLDLICFNYLKSLLLNKNTFIYKYLNSPLIYQKQEIKLNDTNQFLFDECFEILDFNINKYDYSFNENDLILEVSINENYKFNFNYEINEPKIITETKYITETIYIDSNEDFEYSDDHTIYYNCDYYEFELGTDLSIIIKTISDDIECFSNVTCDYSSLNPYIEGEYKAIFYNDYDDVIKTIKII